MKKYLVTFIFYLYSQNIFAMFCPTNFNNINVGDSFEQVRQQCGNPNAENSFTTNSYTGPEIWTYYKKLNSDFNRATIKMTLLIRDDRLVNINIANNNAGQTTCVAGGRQKNGIPYFISCNSSPSESDVTTTNLCGLNIQVGESSQNVMAVCGKPDLISEAESANTIPVQVSEWQYQETPAVTLIFKNGLLAERK